MIVIFSAFLKSNYGKIATIKKKQMELLKGLIAIFIIYVIYLICDYYDCKNEKEKIKEKELRDYFRPTPAKTVEEVEEWCKRKLNK